MSSTNSPGLLESIRDFMEYFELVFHQDWDYTRDNIINDSDMVLINGTFLEPNCDDESNDWCNRGGLLEAYRRLVEALEREGIYPSEIDRSDKDISAQSEKKLMSGADLKQKMFDGKFRGEEQVEEFIVAVLAQSPTVKQDFLDQCGKWAFEKYQEFVKNNPNISADELAKKIGTDGGSPFSRWIRARFIIEIFKQNL